jgi:hypothetical protein
MTCAKNSNGKPFAAAADWTTWQMEDELVVVRILSPRGSSWPVRMDGGAPAFSGSANCAFATFTDDKQTKSIMNCRRRIHHLPSRQSGSLSWAWSQGNRVADTGATPQIAPIAAIAGMATTFLQCGSPNLALHAKFTPWRISVAGES